MEEKKQYNSKWKGILCQTCNKNKIKAKGKCANCYNKEHIKEKYHTDSNYKAKKLEKDKAYREAHREYYRQYANKYYHDKLKVAKEIAKNL